MYIQLIRGSQDSRLGIPWWHEDSGEFWQGKCFPGSKVAERQSDYSRRQGQPYFAGVYDIAGGGMVLQVLLEDLKVAGHGWTGRSGEFGLQGNQPASLSHHDVHFGPCRGAPKVYVGILALMADGLGDLR